jgi:carbon monoxide dehydrogenase subunit G
MATFNARLQTEVPLRCAPDAARAAFLDLDRHIACHPELARAEKLGPDTLRLTMKEMSHGPVSFAGRYTLVFATAGETVRWRPGPDSNVHVSGSAAFRPAPGGGTRLAFTEAVTMDMEMNALAARLLRPVVETMMSRGMKGFLDRMTAELERI